MTPKELVSQIYNDVERDCYYSDIVHKVISSFPDITNDEIGECDDYAWGLHVASCVRFEVENVHLFDTDISDFEMCCQEAVYSVCSNKFLRDEMYEYAVESDAFMGMFYTRSGKDSNLSWVCCEEIEGDFFGLD